MVGFLSSAKPFGRNIVTLSHRGTQPRPLPPFRELVHPKRGLTAPKFGDMLLAAYRSLPPHRELVHDRADLNKKALTNIVSQGAKKPAEWRAEFG